MDVSDEKSVEQMVEKAYSTYNKVDILVNNSGITQLGHTATEDLPVEEWDNIMRVNLRGTFLCFQIYREANDQKRRGQHYQHCLLWRD